MLGSRNTSPDSLAIGLGTEADIDQLVDLNIAGAAVASHRVADPVEAGKLRAYLRSPNAFLIVARVGGRIVGYVAGVVNPTFAREMKRPLRLAEQLWLVCTGRYGFAPGRLRRLARRAYARLWDDPSIYPKTQEAAAVASSTPVGWLNSMVVDRDWRGRGIAGRLLAAADAWLAEREIESVGGDVRCDNRASVRMLSKAGYEPQGAPIWRNGVQVQVMTKTLRQRSGL